MLTPLPLTTQKNIRPVRRSGDCLHSHCVNLKFVWPKAVNWRRNIASVLQKRKTLRWHIERCSPSEIIRSVCTKSSRSCCTASSSRGRYVVSNTSSRRNVGYLRAKELCMICLNAEQNNLFMFSGDHSMYSLNCPLTACKPRLLSTRKYYDQFPVLRMHIVKQCY